MRVLDVGCHDGFVGYWLLGQVRELGWQIDGIELHPHGVEEARRRGYRQVRQGRAEDALDLFGPGGYDAVLAFELIEHVPDVDRLLWVLERMLAEDGVIYLSTPQGTFGAGNNPHHLRAYRSVDLAELLRRRGEIQDMAVGEDGITVAAYKPRAFRRGELAIWTGPSWERWSPLDMESRGLGGSETAAARLAQALSEQGWVVTVYGEVEQGVHRQVVYRHHDTFDPGEPREVFIASRMPEIFDRRINAQRKMLWLHDTDCGDRLSEERAAQIDDVLCLSGWHQMHLVKTYGFRLDGKLRIIRNGIDLERFTKGIVTRRAIDHEVIEQYPLRQPRVLYTSSPDRGLDVLLSLWPQVRERVPDAVLAYCYAPVYRTIAAQDPIVGKHAERIEQLAKGQEGLEDLGSLSQPELARVMRESLVWAHPSYNTPHGVPFFETSCMGAMEAQAAGLHVVASAWGALPETVQVGALIDDDPVPLTESWRELFVDEIVRGLTEEGAQQLAQQRGPEATAHLGWDEVAQAITAIATAIQKL